MIDIKTLLSIAIQKEASDLHLCANAAPVLRIHGTLVPLQEFGGLSPHDIKNMVYGILTPMQKANFERELELDSALNFPNIGRFRINVYMAQQAAGASFRVISAKINSIQELGLPEIILQFCQRRSGLILVTGPTGSGKTTTLAAMIDFINQTRNSRIVIVEDPVEYLHFHKKSMIIQREVYQDTRSFTSALRQALRQDPNVICVGEMRDLDTIATVLTAAETGHLVFSTLHTPDAVETINRIVDVFPPHQQEQVKVQLSSCLGVVIAQKLIQRKDKKGRAIATEILVANSAVRNLIKENKTNQIETIIQTSSGIGMHTMESSIMSLYQNGVISKEAALFELPDKESRQKLENLP